MSAIMTTWRDLLDEEMYDHSDDTAIKAIAPDESVLDIQFDCGYGNANGPAVLVWTDRRVYFPVTYDGAEAIRSAPRHPRTDGQDHVG